jgi:hypothetical protein
MSLISVQVKGITDLEASAEVTCPESGNVIGRLSLRQTLLKYLKLTDGNPMCAELHQHGPQGPVDMVIPNTSLAECGFEMFNKQPAGYLYHVLPKFGASELFIKSLLCRSMEAKARRVIDDLQADVVCYNEHRQNLRLQANKNGFRQMFNGGETDLGVIASHNVHETVGKYQEGGTAVLSYGNLLQQFDPEGSGRDDLGLGRWTYMRFVGDDRIVTRVICG